MLWCGLFVSMGCIGVIFWFGLGDDWRKLFEVRDCEELVYVCVSKCCGLGRGWVLVWWWSLVCIEGDKDLR